MLFIIIFLFSWPQSFNILLILNAASFLTLIAYRFPYITIILVFFLGDVMGQEAQKLLPEHLKQPALGPLTLRCFDPMLL